MPLPERRVYVLHDAGSIRAVLQWITGPEIIGLASVLTAWAVALQRGAREQRACRQAPPRGPRVVELSRWTGHARHYRVTVEIRRLGSGRLLHRLNAMAVAGAELAGRRLDGADLRSADLRDARLQDTTLRGADLGEATLAGASLRHADLRGANVGQANLAHRPTCTAPTCGAPSCAVSASMPRALPVPTCAAPAWWARTSAASATIPRPGGPSASTSAPTTWTFPRRSSRGPRQPGPAPKEPRVYEVRPSPGPAVLRPREASDARTEGNNLPYG